ncbi:MAG: DUF5011 domain-containing protein, partial [Verrucomicrobiales bacterium]|nr:DUF5011 domain-containing protein [Verrucomicrobiales bacterium]
AGGSGISGHDIYLAEDDGPFVLWLDNKQNISAEFAGRPGHTYAFYSIARDNVGHEEPPPIEPDALITIAGVPEDTTPPTVICPPPVTVPVGASCQTLVPNILADVTASDDVTPRESLILAQSPEAETLVGLGTTTIIVTVTDEAGNRATCPITLTVIDATGPTVTLIGANPMAVECGASFSDPGASAVDICAGTVAVSNSGVVDPSMPGTYTITYSAIDPSGNPTTAIRAVNVVDTTAPVISLNGANPFTVECHTAFVDPGASANDACAGSVAVGTSGVVDPNTPGSYTITYSATDPSGNPATATRTVNVVDTTAPVITLNGANPFTVECHSAFDDPGASANDACAGSVPVGNSGVVDLNTPGSYTITYSATDPSGNPATATRTVNVVDTTSPVITLNSDNPLIVPCSTAFSDPGATASDACAGTIPVTPSGSIDVNTPGDYRITYTAIDGSGNTVTSIRTVTVSDNCPTCALVCPEDITVGNDDGLCSAVVTFADPVFIGCVEPVTVVCDPPSGSEFPVGSTPVNCTATDAAGNTATCSFTVTVEDREPPAITCPPELAVQCLSELPSPGFAGGGISDNCDPNPVVTHVGDVAAGTNPTVITRTYQATDANSNGATCTQTITIQGIPGDLNADCCVNRNDFDDLLSKIRARSTDLTYDVNRDGKVDIADVLTLVLFFTNPGGRSCDQQE